MAETPKMICLFYVFHKFGVSGYNISFKCECDCMCKKLRPLHGSQLCYIVYNSIPIKVIYLYKDTKFLSLKRAAKWIE